MGEQQNRKCSFCEEKFYMGDMIFRRGYLLCEDCVKKDKKVESVISYINLFCFLVIILLLLLWFFLWIKNYFTNEVISTPKEEDLSI